MLPIANIIPSEGWIVVLVLLVIIFGVKKLPELARSMGEGIHEFKKAAKKAQMEDDEESAAKPEPTPKSD